MDNDGQVRERVRARDLTEEINQATDLVMAAGAENLNQLAQANLAQGRERVQQMGWRVIDGGRHGVGEMTEVGAMSGAGIVPEMGVVTETHERLTPVGEVARDELELTQPESFVGDESKIQIKERLADDLEDARNEAGEGLSFENRIVAKNQEEVARAVAPEVDKLVGQASFRVKDLEKIYRQGVHAMLKVFNREIGERN